MALISAPRMVSTAEPSISKDLLMSVSVLRERSFFKGRLKQGESFIEKSGSSLENAIGDKTVYAD